MIFRDTWEQVIDRTKTKSRRIVKEDEDLVTLHYDPLQIKAVSKGVPFRVSRLKWVEGREYAIQPAHGHKAVGRFLLKEISNENLQDITKAEIRAEGIEAPDDMLFGEWEKLWDGLHAFAPGKRWDDDPLVWVLTIECVDPFGWGNDTKSTHYFTRLPEPIFWSKKKNGEEGFLHYISRCGNSFATELERVDMPPGRGCQSCNSLIKHDRNKIRITLANKQ